MGGGGGTLTAKIGETEIKTDTTVEHGKTVTLTATPDKGYKVKGWTLDDNAVNGTAETYTLAVTQSATITVSFEPKKALLTLEAGKNTVKVKAKTADGSAIKVEGCTVTELANDTETTLTVTAPDNKITLIGDITELNCSGEAAVGGNRPLIALDVSGLTALQKLDCAKNQLTALNVQGLKNLQELNCGSNELSTLNVQDSTKLQQLDCSVNKLSTLNVQGLNALQKLDCYRNKLTELNVQGCTSLQKLLCENNDTITALNVQGCTSLQELRCPNAQLAILDVQGLTKLQQLECYGNQLTTLNVQGCTSLQKLNCETNQLKTLNVQGCTSLKILLCDQNKLNADAFIKLFNDLPTREGSDNAEAILYSKETGVAEGNCTDFTQPASLKAAFDNAKDAKHWAMKKLNGVGFDEDI
ncbi:leucine-rich repeat domain-containing protein [Treponema sp. OMZ 906]|uniref:InlB B-repeat-containing protein n=1 Tax=Treponema sp. OMZ 906 TaxID=2563662 RepID=UPI0020A28EB9|nr:leucine-rich repeat domain-containing protein [Treponema sp. OMZ 906]